MKRITVVNEPFFEEVQEFLNMQQKVCIKVRGTSMRPFLHDGDMVLLVSLKTAKVCRGSIVLARTDYGIILHRVVRINHGLFILAGDANVRRTERISAANVIGIVAEAYRGDMTLNINSFTIRLGALFWYIVRPLRGYLLHIFSNE
jgi:signal peptidase I